jgi:FG-GAP-like repeat/Dockerin type I domain
MKRSIEIIGVALLLIILNLQLSPLFAQGTAFTYQGRLTDGGSPANGIYDLRFGIYDSSNVPGNLIAGPLTSSAIGVTNGLFTVTLDFGPGVFTGPDRWLDIAARTNGGTFATLVPRQRLAPSPYAITAGNVSGTVSASQLSGSVPLASLPTTILVTNGQAGVNLTGTFSGNGAGVTNMQFFNLNFDTAVTLAWPGIFGPASSLAVGNDPDSVTAADVNGDGKLDLICANLFGSTLSVLTNNGSGGFALASSPTVGNEPESVVAMDVNGDGKVDLICAAFDQETLSVLTNNGNGGFVTASSPTVGNVPESVAAADVNGDGRVDLISANRGDDTLSVLTNNGSGGFVLASSPGVGSGADSVVAADVNGDGKVDLICANDDNNTLSVLTNNGSGSFVPASLPATGNGPISVAAADVNGDGRMDLICANHSANTLSVLFNQPVMEGHFGGDGSGLMNLNAANLTGPVPSSSLTSVPAGSLTGTIADARLSANVALLNGTQNFTGANMFNNAGNSPARSPMPGFRPMWRFSMPARRSPVQTHLITLKPSMGGSC